RSLEVDWWGPMHFRHMETADRKWLERIGGAQKQTVQDNLLSYDALGCFQHLKEWLFLRTKPCKPQKAQILAIKYENLWDPATLEAIQSFLQLKEFSLPLQKERGQQEATLSPHEQAIRKAHNLGTYEKPIYAAYDKARVIWDKA